MLRTLIQKKETFEQVFLSEIKDKDNVNIPRVLRDLQKEQWIKDISPKMQSKAAELLKKWGYKPGYKTEKGIKCQVWLKK